MSDLFLILALFALFCFGEFVEFCIGITIIVLFIVFIKEIFPAIIFFVICFAVWLFITVPLDKQKREIENKKRNQEYLRICIKEMRIYGFAYCFHLKFLPDHPRIYRSKFRFNEPCPNKDWIDKLHAFKKQKKATQQEPLWGKDFKNWFD